MKKFFLMVALMTAGFMNKVNAQYLEIGDVEVSHAWGAPGGYSVVSFFNGHLSCLGVGGWSCAWPAEWGGNDPWRLGNIGIMLNHANTALNSNLLVGSYEQTFLDPATQNSESLKVTWSPSPEGTYVISLYRWMVSN